MILATDVHYVESGATAAGVLFREWSTDLIAASYSLNLTEVAPYEPGAFYKRELPCLLGLIASIPVDVKLVLVDGYVDLEPGHPGLGRHLFEALGQGIPVVGVAKTRFQGAQHREVLRGNSKNPLFVTAAGLEEEIAAFCVRSMNGPHRIPKMLQQVDALSRGRRTGKSGYGNTSLLPSGIP